MFTIKCTKAYNIPKWNYVFILVGFVIYAFESPKYDVFIFFKYLTYIYQIPYITLY